MSQSTAINSWICVGTSQGLRAQSVQRAQIGNHDLVVWRGSDGRVRAWQNRCPHRGMRLSFGFVRGDRLTCLYHGWTYDGEGSCAAIPAHPKLKPPRTITVSRYDCAEEAGLIWVASAGATGAPRIAGDEWKGCRSLRIEAAVELVAGAVKGFAGGVPNELEQARAAAPTELMTNTFRLDLGDLGRPIICALQPVGTDETLLHIAVGGPQASETSVRRAASEWAKRLRRVVESERPTTTVAAAA